MNEKIEKVLTIVGVFLLVFIILGVAWGRIKRLERQIWEMEHAPADTVTVVKHDTVKIDNPIPVIKYVKDKEYVPIHDTTLLTETDTIIKLIELPREYLVYKDSTYRAVVSGVDPRLDSMEVYQKTITNTVTKYIPQKPKTFAPFLEGGMSVNARDNKEVMGEAGLGVMVKGKVGVAAEWKHNFQTKQDFIGGKMIVRF